MYAELMPTISKSILIKCSRETVFNSLTAWDKQSEWMVGTQVKAMKSGGHAKGGTLSARTGLGRVGFVDTMTITAWNPPQQCSVTHTGKIVKGSGDFIVTKLSEDSSLFTWREVIDLPLGIIGRIGWVFVSPFAQLGIVLSLRRFKGWVENK